MLAKAAVPVSFREGRLSYVLLTTMNMCWLFFGRLLLIVFYVRLFTDLSIASFLSSMVFSFDFTFIFGRTFFRLQRRSDNKWNFGYVLFKFIFMIDSQYPYEIVLSWISLNFNGVTSTSIQVPAWSLRAPTITWGAFQKHLWALKSKSS